MLNKGMVLGGKKKLLIIRNENAIRGKVKSPTLLSLFVFLNSEYKKMLILQYKFNEN